jgi:hypothetical protein
MIPQTFEAPCRCGVSASPDCPLHGQYAARQFPPKHGGPADPQGQRMNNAWLAFAIAFVIGLLIPYLAEWKDHG